MTQLTGAAVFLENVSRVFPDGTGLQPTTLDIDPGEFVSILGPSGCGKSTLLRCIAGLETPDTGTINLGDRTVFASESKTNVAVNQRGFSMVFQDLALWPHMSVAQNVEFPLTVQTPRMSATERKAKVQQALDMVSISAKAAARPHELSGGQQQRVAIARALVSNPDLLLLDEPLSALDAALRVQIRAELMQLSSDLGLTMIYVTHDQHEALAMSDRVVVMNDGRVYQFASPVEIYESPTDTFVGDFVGTMNRHSSGLALRPEACVVSQQGQLPQDYNAPAAFHGTVLNSQYVGGRYQIRCTVEGAADPWLVYAEQAFSAGDSILVAPAT